MKNTNLKNWFLAIRPRTMMASIGPVILGLSAAYFINQEINILVAALTLICAVLLQFATNIANDYLDFKKGVDTVERIGPLRVTSNGLISVTAMRNALIILLGLAFIFGLYLMAYGGMYIVIIGLLSLYFAYGYTGGPFPLSYMGLGEVSALVFFGLFAVTGTTYLQIRHHDHLSLILGLSVGLISAAILAINNLRDITTDKINGKRTLAVRMGETFQRRLIVVLVLAPLFINLYLTLILGSKLILIGNLSIIPFLRVYRSILNDPISPLFNKYLGMTAMYLFLYSLLTGLGLIFSL